jgi:hypothetical protein
MISAVGCGSLRRRRIPVSADQHGDAPNLGSRALVRPIVKEQTIKVSGEVSVRHKTLRPLLAHCAFLSSISGSAPAIAVWI